MNWMRRLGCFLMAFAVCTLAEALAVLRQEPGAAVRGLQNSADPKQLWQLPDSIEEITPQFIARLEKDATANDSQAQASLALCYHTGRGVALDLAKAAEWYQKAAANGHAGAQNNLASFYDEGIGGVPLDQEKAYQLYLSAARQNFPHAQYNVGWHYAKGIVVKQDWATAMTWYRKAASQGHLASMHSIGWIYLLGNGVAVDLEAAKRYLIVPAQAGLATSQFVLGAALLKQEKFEGAAHWFQRSGEGGSVAGQLYWALALFEGKGVKQDRSAALEWARKASDQGYDEAQVLTARILFGEEDKTLADPQEAARYARLAAEQGHPDGQHLLGLCYHRGTGVERNLSTAIQWYTRAAEQKHAGAAGTLGILYEKGVELPVSFQEAAKWYRVAAEEGDSLAQYRLGLFYRDGTGVAVDLEEAKKWLRLAVKHYAADREVQAALAEVERLRSNQPAIQAESDFRRGFDLAKEGERDADKFREAAEILHRAADAGHAGAQALLSGMYRRGDGVPQDEAKAEAFFAKARATSDPRAQYLLGMGHSRKGRIPPEYAPMAVSFFQRAALQGYPPAQNGLGYALMSGTGVECDRVEAFKWLALAAAKGHKLAETNLRRLRPMLMPKEVEEGKRRAKSFRPVREKEKQRSEKEVSFPVVRY